MTRKKEISIRFQLTQEEKDKIIQEAQKSGLKPHTFVKMITFKHINKGN